MESAYKLPRLCGDPIAAYVFSYKDDGDIGREGSDAWVLTARLVC